MDKRLLEVRGRDRLYTVWVHMKERCYNKNLKRYKDYGGRGITICDEWLNDSEAFMIWAVDNGWRLGLVIDRKDNESDYSPENCRFVTYAESTINSRPKTNNTSGFIGVHQHSDGNWVAQIAAQGKRRYLGYFKSPRMAALRYDAEAFIINDGRPTNFN